MILNEVKESFWFPSTPRNITLRIKHGKSNNCTEVLNQRYFIPIINLVFLYFMHFFKISFQNFLTLSEMILLHLFVWRCLNFIKF